ncbi:MAG: YfhO family protein, partial [Acidobacteriaceae bacterium]|nr:YfhO family protein [Acidobacteriaceae bacterium]
MTLLMLGLIFFDISAFNWIPDKIDADKKGQDEYRTLLTLYPVAEFLRGQPQPFRVAISRDLKPNIGDSYGIQSISGAGAAVGKNFARISSAFDLLNVRYLIKAASANDAQPIFHDPNWKVFENRDAFPRAWLVHQTKVERDDEKAYADVNLGRVNLRDVAIVSQIVAEPLGAPAPGSESVTVISYSAHAIRLRVHASSPGLLVLSEVYWPEWHAMVNKQETPIYKADGALRSIPLPAGDSDIEFVYRPWSVYIGALLTILTFFGTITALVFDRRIPENRTQLSAAAGVDSYVS